MARWAGHTGFRATCRSTHDIASAECMHGQTLATEPWNAGREIDRIMRPPPSPPLSWQTLRQTLISAASTPLRDPQVALTLLGILFLVGNFALEAGRLVMMQFLLQVRLGQLWRGNGRRD